MAAIIEARAWGNNEVGYLAWKTDGKIEGCLGFMISRIHLDDNGNVTERRILPAWAAFKTQSNPNWQPQDTSVWPVQKFTWRDLTLRRRRDRADVRAGNFTVRYEIVAVGKPAPGRAPVPNSPDADPSKYQGDAVGLFFCSAPATTNEIFVTTDIVTAGGKPVISAGFTNGILSTQNLRKQLQTADGRAPTKAQLQSHIDTDQPDKIRTFLSADAVPLIAGFMDRSRSEDCDLYLALYELNDPELIEHITANAARVHLILSTAGSSKPAKGAGGKTVWDTTNRASRALLRDKVAEFHDRMFNNSAHIGHNKFAVLVERSSNRAKAVLSGSTNWTFSGLCTQTNNVIIIDDESVAKAYLAYWQRLRDDKLPVPKPISAPNSNKQGAALRKADTTPSDSVLSTAPATRIELWYSPNTQSATKTARSPVPPDLGAAFELMNGAKDAIFFLTFMSSVRGEQSIISDSIDAALRKPDLLVFGAISDGMALPSDVGAAKRGVRGKAGRSSGQAPPAKRRTGTAAPRGAAKRRAMTMAARTSVRRSAKPGGSRRAGRSLKSVAATKSKAPTRTKAAKARTGSGPIPRPAIYENPKAPKVLMIRAAAINNFDLIGNFEQEMLKFGQAIIHDKIVVIDPLSDGCVVITGSHNLGYKASYANDENMLIIRGNRALAAAYAVHVLDVYDHYKFRAILEQQAFERKARNAARPEKGQGILAVDDSWQDPYFDGTKGQEREYFLGARSS